jgi:hypothetical protein
LGIEAGNASPARVMRQVLLACSGALIRSVVA